MAVFLENIKPVQKSSLNKITKLRIKFYIGGIISDLQILSFIWQNPQSHVTILDNSPCLVSMYSNNTNINETSIYFVSLIGKVEKNKQAGQSSSDGMSSIFFYTSHTSICIYWIPTFHTHVTLCYKCRYWKHWWELTISRLYHRVCESYQIFNSAHHPILCGVQTYAHACLHITLKPYLLCSGLGHSCQLF